MNKYKLVIFFFGLFLMTSVYADKVKAPAFSLSSLKKTLSSKEYPLKSQKRAVFMDAQYSELVKISQKITAQNFKDLFDVGMLYFVEDPSDSYYFIFVALNKSNPKLFLKYLSQRSPQIQKEIKAIL